MVCRVKVFISWSGDRSKLLAEALRDWIQDVIQTVECFCSTDDIRAGQRWNDEVNSWLGDTDFGILCVTPENLKAPWLHFEAGALAKRISNEARVVPVTLGFQPSALEAPLSQFNGVSADRQGIAELIKSVAEASKSAITIERAFEKWWPDLEHRLSGIPDSEAEILKPEPPDVTEMFADIMSSVRGLSNDFRRGYPGRRTTTSEFRAAARLLAEMEDLRDDVLRGSPGAIRYLRERAWDSASADDRENVPLTKRRKLTSEALRAHGIQVAEDFEVIADDAPTEG